MWCVCTEAAVQLGTASESDYAHPLAEQLVEVALTGAVAPLKRHVGLTHAGHLLSLLLVFASEHGSGTEPPYESRRVDRAVLVRVQKTACMHMHMPHAHAHAHAHMHMHIDMLMRMYDRRSNPPPVCREGENFAGVPFFPLQILAGLRLRSSHSSVGVVELRAAVPSRRP